jgi:hypothetical protein
LHSLSVRLGAARCDLQIHTQLTAIDLVPPAVRRHRWVDLSGLRTGRVRGLGFRLLPMVATAYAAHRQRPTDVSSGSKPAVPSTTEHSRSTFNCGRTVTLPSRREVAEPHNWKLEAVDRRRIETPYKPLYAANVARDTGTPAEHEAERAAGKRRAHDHEVLARALCKQRSCSNVSSNTAPLPPLPQG